MKLLIEGVYAVGLYDGNGDDFKNSLNYLIKLVYMNMIHHYKINYFGSCNKTKNILEI